MNKKPKTKRFSKTFQPPAKSKRKPKTKTLAKIAVLETYGSIDDAKEDVLKVYARALKNGTEAEKMIAAKEVSKFLFPTKQSISGDLNIKQQTTTEFVVVPAFEVEKQEDKE